ncbi:sperm-specific sodium:proton exchanger-like isoform X2 [Mytilus edulis]|uniref:sperm-specific sodium:proton exchanger-like isoform X2 n=1 Tax=Mytilus edulis TaxID=6550 RepID=UPI0039EEDD79
MNLTNCTGGLCGLNVNIPRYDHTGEHESAVILFITVSLAVGALVRRLLKGFKIRLPYTVVLLVLGILFGLLSGQYEEIHIYAKVVDSDPHLILHIFLPVLIFESAFAMDFHTFVKTFVQVVVLAIPGLALASVFTCLLARYLFTYGWNWNEGMMFGSILSATDPVAVVALLSDLGASKKLAMVIEGESLLNDGAAIVFFNVFLKLTTEDSGISDIHSKGGEIVLYFLQVALLGPLWGYVMAKCTLFFLSRVFNDALIEITITLASTYLTYYIGEEFLKVSGVLAVVVLGVRMSAEKTMISPEVEKFLHRFWETLAYIANTLIFIIVGMVISEKAIFEIHGLDWFYMFSLYFGIFVIRGLVIAIFSPILRHTGYGMSWKEGIVMTWGGLRGAVSLALALQVAHHDTIDQERVGVRVLVHVSGIVFLTLLINSTTVVGLLKLLGMSDTSPAKRMAMANSLRFLQDVRDKTLNMLKTDRFLADADWDTVEKSSEIVDPYKTTDEEAQIDDSLDIRPNAICPDCDCKLPCMYTRKEMKDMTDEAVLRMLKAEKMSYWRQFEQGMISREGVRKLQECTDIAADKKGRFVDVEDVKKSWEIPKIYIKLKKFFKRFVVELIPEPPKSTCLTVLYKIFKHAAFSIFLYCVIALDMANVTLSVISEYLDAIHDHKEIFRSLNVVFVSFYIVEAVAKIVLVKKYYFTVCWNNLCLAIIFIGIVDVCLSFSLPSVYGNNHHIVHIVLVVFILLRVIRLFRLLEPLVPLFLGLMKLLISQQLSYGYDVGRGYVAGEEEVRKLIDHMVDQREIAKSLKQASDNGRLDVIRCLGMLQKQHPDIALSIKTRQAIRSVLNSLRDGIHELLMDGILEEADGHKLEKMVEEMMKRLINAPPSLPIPPPDKMLNNVFWLRHEPTLIEYIKVKAKLITYNYEDVIIHEGDPPGGIYIIVSGMVRLESTTQPGKPIILEDKPSGSQLTIKSHLIDFLTSGNIIGEMGLLTKNPRSATVICETAVQLLFISLDDMEHAIHHFHDIDPPLEYRLWHVCANRVATNVLMKQPSYQGWTKEKIKIRIENSYLLSDLDDNMFTVDSSMCDVVLVNGFAQNAFTREQFIGPCYIPWTVLKLQLMPEKGPKPVLLVVPSEAGQPAHAAHKSGHDLRHGHGAFSNSISQLCLNHASKHRQSVESKWKKKRQKKNLGFTNKVQAARSLGILLSKGAKVENRSTPKPEMVNGNLNREMFKNPICGALSTPGMLEGREKVNFKPEKSIQEEPERGSSIEGSGSSISHLSSVVSLDKLNAQLHARKYSDDDDDEVEDGTRLKVKTPVAQTVSAPHDKKNTKQNLKVTVSDPLGASKPLPNNSNNSISKVNHQDSKAVDTSGQNVSDTTQDTRL